MGESGDDDDGDDGSTAGACLERRGRMEYVPVSHISSEPVSLLAVSIRWFYERRLSALDEGADW